MAKRKVSRKYTKKGIMERQMQQDKKMPSQKPRQKINWKQFIKRLPRKISKFFIDMVRELKKVTWPNRKTLLTYTLIVIVTIAIFAVILGFYDFIFLQLVEILASV